MAFAASLRAREWALSAATSLTMVCVAPRAFAQASPAGGAASAEEHRIALYRDATAAAVAGRWGDARDRLREALAIRSSPKVLFSLAQAEEKLGAVASAQADYGRALEGARAAGESEVVQAAEQASVALMPRVPHVRVFVTSVSNGASATLDAQPMALGTAVALDPGAHRIVVRAPRAREVTTNVAIGEQQELDVPVSLTLEAPVIAAAEATPSTTFLGPRRTAGLITAGAGVVALAVGTILGLESIASHDSAQKACPGTTCPDAASAALWTDAVTKGNVSTAAFIVAGASLVGGALLWFTAPRPGAATQVGLGPESITLRGAW